MFRSAAYIVVILAGLIIGLASAQEPLVQQPPQPVIHGEANGMTVVAQNDTVAYVASKTPSPLLDKPACYSDLHCVMRKNDIGTLLH